MSRGVIAAVLVGILALKAVLSMALIGSNQEGTAAAAPAGDQPPDVSFLLFDGTGVTGWFPWPTVGF